MTLDDLKSYRAVERAPVRGTLSRLRHRLDAAALLRRRAADRDAQHPRRLSRCDAGAMRRRAASDDRGDEARLCRPRAVSRRSRSGQGAGRRADVEALRRRRCAPRSIRKRATPSREIRAGDARAARERQHHAFFRRRPLRQRGRQHLHAQSQLRRRPGRRGHRHPAQQRARRFRRQAGRAQRLRPRRLRGQRARAGQAAAVVDDADHRAEGRQAVPRHRLARRQPHHHRGAADRCST